VLLVLVVELNLLNVLVVIIVQNYLLILHVQKVVLSIMFKYRGLC
jgi:hypothetical protein